MAAFIPSKRDPEVNEQAFTKVRDDKTREASAGFDGSWVAHPGMVELCREVFEGHLGDSPNQLGLQRADVAVSADDLLDAASTPGELTLEGLRANVSVGIQYLQAWLQGNGAVAIHNLMEDAATAEISRSQIWQWLNAGAHLASGEQVTRDLVDQVVEQEYAAQRRGFTLRSVAGGWRVYSRSDYAPVVEKFLLDGQQAKLTQASLETLAVIAYRQPISRSRVSAVRGVNVDGVVRTLLNRGLIEELGAEGDSGAVLYGTTAYFLQRLGLGTLDELPALAPYLPEIDLLDEIAEQGRG
jgi:segregation and condensation protein B